MQTRLSLCLFSLILIVALAAPAQTPPARTAHYIASTHWDREWYEPFQGFRMRLVSLLDEAFDTFGKEPQFRNFVTDGQAIPVFDYLEVRPEKRELVERYVREGRLLPGPWYVEPDEWLVSGESLVRNLQLGTDLCRELGSTATVWPGFVNDQFGHTGQMPQILDQMGCPVAFVWRGAPVGVDTACFNWRAPDGTTVPTYRFGAEGYTTFQARVRDFGRAPFDPDSALERLIRFVHAESARSATGTLLLYDGRDHIEIEPRMPAVLARANERLAAEGIRVVHSTPADYMRDLLAERGKITRSVTGELRMSCRTQRDGKLIPGVLSSRIHLKQKNARCEDELTLWAEPFSAFAALALGAEYPTDYLRLAWKQLLENHPHDSMCGCSIDQIHQDMLYRFDQSLGISSHLSAAALKSLAEAAAPKTPLPESALFMAVFNPTASALDEPVDLDICLPTDWATTFEEFFGYERKFAFILRGPDGAVIPWQLCGQAQNREGFRRERYQGPEWDPRNLVRVCCQLKVPAFGYTTLSVEPAPGPVRYSGSLKAASGAIENEFLLVRAEPGGTLSVTDKRSGRTYSGLLAFEDCADIGDGWFHGVAVNDRVQLSSACGADISVLEDGFARSTLRIDLTMNLPAEFDFRDMRRSERTAALRIISDITLRRGADRLEVSTRVENNVLDHRLRVLLPTGVKGGASLSNSAFDIVERPVALPADNDSRDELAVETVPRESWTAFGDGAAGLAVIARGLPECAVLDTPQRPLALTLLRSFRKAVFADDNPGGQIQGPHEFRYDILPLSGPVPVERLCLLGQRVGGAARSATLLPRDLYVARERAGALPREHSFLAVEGPVVVTAVQEMPQGLAVRFFNPRAAACRALLSSGSGLTGAESITLAGAPDNRAAVHMAGEKAQVDLPGKRICTLVLKSR
ncbi:glycoside hydrolase family 38 [bacterium]|nr:glycoside hydrolase family 38 [bacterium]